MRCGSSQTDDCASRASRRLSATAPGCSIACGKAFAKVASSATRTCHPRIRMRTIYRKESAAPTDPSVPPHQADQLALQLYPVGAEDAGLVGLVGRFESDGIALAPQALQGDFAVIDQRHHDRAVLGTFAALDQHRIT